MVGNGIGPSSGYGQFPNNHFSPTMYAKQFLMFNRIASIADMVTNTDFTGEISDAGDTVEILKEPNVTTRPYKRGQKLVRQELDDDYLQLVIDKAEYFSFGVDDIEKRLSHMNWMEAGKSSGMYNLMNVKDKDILQYMADNATTGAGLGIGVSGTPVTIGFGSGETSPLNYLNQLGTILDENDVPDDGQRFIVASPKFFEKLRDETSLVVQADKTGDPLSVIRSRKYGMGEGYNLHGFNLLKTNNNPKTAADDITVMAGHKNSTASVTSLTKTRVIEEHPDYFGSACDGLLVWGRKVLKSENLFVGAIDF